MDLFLARDPFTKGYAPDENTFLVPTLSTYVLSRSIGANVEFTVIIKAINLPSLFLE